MKSGNLKRILLGGALAAVAVFYALVDPEGSVPLPQCLVHRLTGFDCPGCGSQRMLHALLHGHLREAWDYNAFLLCMIPLMALMGWSELKRHSHPRLYRVLYSLPVIYSLCGGIVLWTIFRNIDKY